MEMITQHDIRLAVKDLHDSAEQTKLAKDLMSGNIDPIVYKNYCYQLYLIADVIESNVRLPPSLCRKLLLIDDMLELPSGTVKACPSTIEYVDYLSRQYKPALQGQSKGHIYTHYLGWLYGGQMIAKNITLPTNHLKFDNVKTCVNHIRDKILVYLTDYDKIEARKAFEYTIKIYQELYELH